MTYKAVFNLELGRKNKCILPISLGQVYHSGDQFKAIINQFIITHRQNQNIDKVLIITPGHLYRHDHMLLPGVEEQEALAFALEDQAKWLRENQTSIDELEKAGITVEVKAWDEWWSEDPNNSKYARYQEQKRIVEEKYSKRPEVKTKFDIAVGSYVGHFIDKNASKKGFSDSYNKEHAEKTSLNFIQEECAVFSLPELQNEYDYFLYPFKGNTVSENVLAALQIIADQKSRLQLANIKVYENGRTSPIKSTSTRSQKNLRSENSMQKPTSLFDGRHSFFPLNTSNNQEWSMPEDLSSQFGSNNRAYFVALAVAQSSADVGEKMQLLQSILSASPPEINRASVSATKN